MKRFVLFSVLTFCSVLTGFNANLALPLLMAHSHNDYERSKPLLDALDHGFCSVEADIYLVNGQLLVAHDLDRTRTNRTLESLYLEPLRRRVKANGGRVYPQMIQFTLLIDIKSEGEKTYQALAQVLKQYPDVLTHYQQGQIHQNAVTVIISGNRPKELLAREPLRFAAIDGRLEDLEKDEPVHLVPLISDNWTKLFRWEGHGSIPATEQERLRAIVEKAHQQGRRLRFWGAPDQPPVWKELLEAGVDLINTDNLGGLRDFLLSQKH